jgi:protein phosphatase
MAQLHRMLETVYRLRQRLLGRSMESYPYRFAMQSSPGRVRRNNEDTCAAAQEFGAFVVCDGMGGAAAGEVASRMAAERFLKALAPPGRQTPRTATPDMRLQAAVEAANRAVFQQARRSEQMHGMGTTLVGLLVEVSKAMPDRPSMTLVHVGDSRCYRLRGGELKLLTRDHSLVEEQVRVGAMTALEAEHHPMRNIITRAVGSEAKVEPEITWLEPLAGDLYLLASDGLTRELSEEVIAQTMQRAVAKAEDGRPKLESLCQTLIDEANDAGGGDNITVLLVQML